jgi:phage terminase large subunit-like protein
MTLAPGSYRDEARADRAVAFFELLRHIDGQFYNKPFDLLPWQEKIIRDVYGTIKEDGTRQYRVIWLEIPKKNGKSEMGAGAAIFGTFADGEMNGEVYGCAADRGQASIIYKVATKMIDLVPALAKRARKRDSIKKIEDRVSGSFYEVLSAEAYTKHGFKPSTIVFDEIHAQPNSDLWNVMTFGTGATREQQLIWVLTTAGDDPDRNSIGWEMHDYALRVLNGEIVDPTWYVVIYSYDGDDIWNEANWAEANPSMGEVKSIDTMRAEAIAAQNDPAKEKLFRQFHLNQWVTTKLTSWLPLELYDETEEDIPEEDLHGLKFFIGQDASTTTDLSALCRIYPPQQWLDFYYIKWLGFIPEDSMYDRVRIDHVPYDIWQKKGWLTATEGNTIDHWAMLETVQEWQKQGHIVELVSDPAFAVMLTQAELKAGINVVTVQGTFANLTDPMNNIEMLLKSGRMKHEKNDLARWCFGNTSIAMNGSGLKKFVKETKGKTVIRTKRIDLMAALILGMCRVPYENKAESAYESRGLVIL